MKRWCGCPSAGAERVNGFALKVLGARRASYVLALVGLFVLLGGAFIKWKGN